MKQARDCELPGGKERLEKTNELDHEQLLAPGEAAAEVFERLSRRQKGESLQTKRLRDAFQVNSLDLREISGTPERGCKFGRDRNRGGIQVERLDHRPVHDKRRADNRLNPHNVRPANLQVVAGHQRLDLRARLWWGRCVAALADVLKNRQRHTEHVDVFSAKQFPLDPVCADDRLSVVADAAQSTANHLFAQQLTREGSQAEDMRDILGVPTLR